MQYLLVCFLIGPSLVAARQPYYVNTVQARIRYLTQIQLVSLRRLLSSSQLVLAVGGWSELII